MPLYKNSKYFLWYREKIQPHEQLVRHWLESRFGEYCEVDDVMQEALLKVFEAKDKGEVRSPKAFLFSVARNVAVTQIRKSKVRVACNFDDLEDELLDEEVDVAKRADRNHELEILTKAIQSLPERCQQVFTLSKVYGMSYQKIADELGISFHTVSRQITIGLSKCTEYMHRNGKD